MLLLRIIMQLSTLVLRDDNYLPLCGVLIMWIVGYIIFNVYKRNCQWFHIFSRKMLRAMESEGGVLLRVRIHNITIKYSELRKIHQTLLFEQ